MQDFREYSRWYRASITCAECRECAFIRNGNIDGPLATAPGGTLAVRPQGGFVEPEWFSRSGVFRVLVLGLNPKGGTRLYRESGDYALYGSCYPRIMESEDTAVTLKSEVPSIRGFVLGYRPTSSFISDLARVVRAVKGTPAIVGYANQVLCRTEPEADALGDAVEPAYRNCFHTRILPLLQILTPDLVVAMGWRKDGRSWSQQYFAPLFGEAMHAGLLPVSCRWVGVQQTSRPNNAARAIERIEASLRV